MELSEVGEQVYAAQRILKRRMVKGKIQYLIKWKGWSNNDNTWEPEENILDERLINAFNERQNGCSSNDKTNKSHKRCDKSNNSLTIDSKEDTSPTGTTSSSDNDFTPSRGRLKSKTLSELTVKESLKKSSAHTTPLSVTPLKLQRRPMGDHGGVQYQSKHLKHHHQYQAFLRASQNRLIATPKASRAISNSSEKIPGRGRGRPRKNFFVPVMQKVRGRPPGSKNKVKRIVDPTTGVASWHVGKSSPKKLLERSSNKTGDEKQSDKRLRLYYDENEEEGYEKDSCGISVAEEAENGDDLQGVCGTYISPVITEEHDHGSSVASLDLHSEVQKSTSKPRRLSHTEAHNDTEKVQHIIQNSQPHFNQPANGNEYQVHQQYNARLLPQQQQYNAMLPQQHDSSLPQQNHDSRLLQQPQQQRQPPLQRLKSGAFWAPSDAEKRLINTVSITDVTSDALTITIRESTLCDGFFHSQCNATA